MRKTIDTILSAALTFMMAVMTLDVLWGVITRYLLGGQASWTEELARFLLIWIGLLGAAYASGKGMHLAIDLLPGRLEERSQRRLEIAINSIVILFALSVMVIGGLRYVFLTFTLGQISPALQIPMGFVYLVIPISGLLVVYYKWLAIAAKKG